MPCHLSVLCFTVRILEFLTGADLDGDGRGNGGLRWTSVPEEDDRIGGSVRVCLRRSRSCSSCGWGSPLCRRGRRRAAHGASAPAATALESSPTVLPRATPAPGSWRAAVAIATAPAAAGSSP